MLTTIASNGGAKGKKIGIFTPEHKQLLEPFDEILEILSPVKRRSSKNDGEIRTTTGGIVDFWHTNDNPLAGRGREYDIVLLDETAFAKNGQMRQIWERAIKPTLLTRRGGAWVFSTPHGIDEENFFWAICNDPKLGFTQHHAPTAANPYVPPDELAKEKESNHPLVWRQEFEAEFVDWSGVAFFSLDRLLHEGKPVAMPLHVDAVYCTIDTAIKAGSDNDGTGCVYWAISKHIGHPLVILGYELIQIEGSLLESWLPSVYRQLDEYAKLTKARFGAIGAYIEDKGSGSILLQQAARRGWAAEAIKTLLTSVGKDERAMSISGYVHRGMVKLSQAVYDQISDYKGQSRNHLLSQILGFRIGDKDAAKRADDLLDCFTYGISIGLGDGEGN
ncbi:hypothetical protein WM24_23785 [Burkholderia ubonensis]|nr:hypothetical protein WM24_23785 [Burkholderia ubonensis]